MSDWLRWLLIALCLLFALIVRWRGGRRRLGPTRAVVVADGGGRRRRGRPGMAFSVVSWLGVALVVAGVNGGALLWLLGWPRLPPINQFDVSQLLDLLKIALSVVAGFGGVVLLAVNYRKQRVAEDEHALAVQRAERDVVQKFNERFGSAAEQLANESPAVRLAGVYAMAGLADDWADKRQVCVDVLCGYLRIPRGGDGEAEVREAILRVIRDHARSSAPTSWSALDFDFTGVVMENADFARLQFDGEVLFDGAEFIGGVVSFAGTRFTKTLSCHGARFAAEVTNFAAAQTGRLEFVGAEFVGEVVDFSGLELQVSAIDFFRCRFAAKQVNFSRIEVQFGRIRFDKCQFSDLQLDFSAGYPLLAQDVPHVQVDDCRFERCHVDLTSTGAGFRFVRSVLETVTVVDRGEHRALWWNVELRGDTSLPAHHTRVISAATS